MYFRWKELVVRRPVGIGDIFDGEKYKTYCSHLKVDFMVDFRPASFDIIKAASL